MWGLCDGFPFVLHSECNSSNNRRASFHNLMCAARFKQACKLINNCLDVYSPVIASAFRSAFNSLPGHLKDFWWDRIEENKSMPFFVLVDDQEWNLHRDRNDAKKGMCGIVSTLVVWHAHAIFGDRIFFQRWRLATLKHIFVCQSLGLGLDGFLVIWSTCVHGHLRTRSLRGLEQRGSQPCLLALRCC